MRILLATSDLEDRGVNYIRAYNLARVMVRDGHKAAVLASRPERGGTPTRRMQDGVEILSAASPEPDRLRRSGFGLVDNANRRLLLRDRQFDIVHVFGHRPSARAPVRRAGGGRTPVVVADWADWFGFGGIATQRSLAKQLSLGVLDDILERRMPFWSDGISVITRDLEELAVARGFRPDHVLRITAGANTETIRPLPKKPMRSRYGFEPEAPVVMNLGASAWDRGRVVDVFSAIARRQRTARFVVARSGSKDAPKRAASEGWGDRLFQVEHVPHDRIGELLGCADVIVLPFPNNGMNRSRFPNQAADAMAAGRPIVANRTGDLGAFVAETGSGLLAEEGPGPMAEAVVQLLADLHRADQLGANGRRAAEEHLSWPIIAARVMSLYQRLS